MVKKKKKQVSHQWQYNDCEVTWNLATEIKSVHLDK